MGNPPLRPLIYHATDLAIIQLKPCSRNAPPLTAMEINQSNQWGDIQFLQIREINAIIAVNNVMKYLKDNSANHPALEEALNLLPVNPVIFTALPVRTICVRLARRPRPSS